MLFSGKSNSIYISREYYQEYGCEFDLTYYPVRRVIKKSVFGFFVWPICNCVMLLIKRHVRLSCLIFSPWQQFDTQMCRMMFTVQGKTEEYVRLAIDGAGIQFLGNQISYFDLIFCKHQQKSKEHRSFFWSWKHFWYCIFYTILWRPSTTHLFLGSWGSSGPRKRPGRRSFP